MSSILAATLAASAMAATGLPAEERRRDAPPAMSAMSSDRLTLIPSGADEAPAPEASFSGTVRLSGLYQAEGPARIGGATVTFSAGARTAWHSHPLGQTLFIVAGHGLVQKQGEAALRVGPGDVVVIPPQVRHWHGAVENEGMTHFAVAEALDGTAVTWAEKVSDADYAEAARR